MGGIGILHQIKPRKARHSGLPTAGCCGVTQNRVISRDERRPGDFGVNHGMPRFICRTSMLKTPDFDLTEQGKRRLLPMWISDDHFKQPLSNGVAPEWIDNVSIAVSSVGTVFEKGTLHRSC